MATRVCGRRAQHRDRNERRQQSGPRVRQPHSATAGPGNNNHAGSFGNGNITTSPNRRNRPRSKQTTIDQRSQGQPAGLRSPVRAARTFYSRLTDCPFSCRQFAQVHHHQIRGFYPRLGVDASEAHFNANPVLQRAETLDIKLAATGLSSVAGMSIECPASHCRTSSSICRTSSSVISSGFFIGAYPFCSPEFRCGVRSFAKKLRKCGRASHSQRGQTSCVGFRRGGDSIPGSLLRCDEGLPPVGLRPGSARRLITGYSGAGVEPWSASSKCLVRLQESRS